MPFYVLDPFGLNNKQLYVSFTLGVNNRTVDSQTTRKVYAGFTLLSRKASSTYPYVVRKVDVKLRTNFVKLYADLRNI